MGAVGIRWSFFGGGDVLDRILHLGIASCRACPEMGQRSVLYAQFPDCFRSR